MTISKSQQKTTRLVAARYEAINRKVLESLPKSKFDARKVPGQQIRRLSQLTKFDARLHQTWGSLDSGRRSAACRFEWARTLMFMVTDVLPHLENLDIDFFHLTLADKRWRVDPHKAKSKTFARPRRKVRASIQRLRDRGYAPIYVVAFEVSGDSNLAGNYAFEPHAHLLIGGVPKAELRNAFRVRLPASQRGRDKPVKIRPVSHGQLGNILGYLTKMKPQDRVEFRRSDGRPDRNTNHMTPSKKMAWLRCMAMTPITELIQFGGFAVPITSRFIHSQMATIIGEVR